MCKVFMPSSFAKFSIAGQAEYRFEKWIGLSVVFESPTCEASRYLYDDFDLPNSHEGKAKIKIYRPQSDS